MSFKHAYQKGRPPDMRESARGIACRPTIIAGAGFGLVGRHSAKSLAIADAAAHEAMHRRHFLSSLARGDDIDNHWR